MKKAGLPGAVLQEIISENVDGYVLLHRPECFEAPTLEIMVGQEEIVKNFCDIDKLLEERISVGQRLFLVAPYRQILERGFEVIDDQAPFLGMCVEDYEAIPLASAVTMLPEVPIHVHNPCFVPSDQTYEDIVARVIKNEIGAGEGANFVIKRSFNCDISDYDNLVALTIFRNLLQQEKGSYWTFLIRLNGVTLVGASPEKHIQIKNDVVSMTPISGTYRYPLSGITSQGLMEFLSDEKEEAELSMVLDEELKMMTHICRSGVKAVGPFLLEMSRLAHVCYKLEGVTELPISEVLKRSMFAPTVVGSPLQNAARVIARYETCGRSYYSGFAGLLNKSHESVDFDSAIMIRTAEISPMGALQAGIGATLVRDSDPVHEMRETAVKAEAIRRSLGFGNHDSIDKKRISQLLSRRNNRLATFWFGAQNSEKWKTSSRESIPEVIILDNEDAFTTMMAYQIRQFGLKVQIKSFDAINCSQHSQLLIVGPGPGDPCNLADPRVSKSRDLMLETYESQQPFLAVCFGHQILCSLFGLPIVSVNPPNQGAQKEISIFGRTEMVGLYNTFTAVSDVDFINSRWGRVTVFSEQSTGHVYGLQGPNFCSMQFHPESILTRDGSRILQEAIERVCDHSDTREVKVCA